MQTLQTSEQDAINMHVESAEQFRAVTNTLGHLKQQKHDSDLHAVQAERAASSKVSVMLLPRSLIWSSSCSQPTLSWRRPPPITRKNCGGKTDELQNLMLIGKRRQTKTWNKRKTRSRCWHHRTRSRMKKCRSGKKKWKIWKDTWNNYLLLSQCLIFSSAADEAIRVIYQALCETNSLENPSSEKIQSDHHAGESAQPRLNKEHVAKNHPARPQTFHMNVEPQSATPNISHSSFPSRCLQEDFEKANEEEFDGIEKAPAARLTVEKRVLGEKKKCLRHAWGRKNIFLK